MRQGQSKVCTQQCVPTNVLRCSKVTVFPNDNFSHANNISPSQQTSSKTVSMKVPLLFVETWFFGFVVSPFILNVPVQCSGFFPLKLEWVPVLRWQAVMVDLTFEGDSLFI